MAKHHAGKHRRKGNPKVKFNVTLMGLLLPLSIGAAFAIGVVATAPKQEATSFVARPVAPPSDTEELPLGPTRPSESATRSPVTTTPTSAPTMTTTTAQETSEPPATTTRPPTRTTPPPESPKDAPSPVSNSRCTSIGVKLVAETACNAILANVSGVGAIGGLGSRSNASCHPLGLALDFSVSTSVGNSLADYALSQQSALDIKYVIWRQRINYGSGWEPMSDRGGVTANHFDHVHISFLPCVN